MSVMDRLVNLRQLSEMTGLSYENLRRLAVAGRIPAQKIGKRWVVTLAFLGALAPTRQDCDKGV